MSNPKNPIINIPPEAVELAKEIYEDTAQTTAKESSKLISRIPRLINAGLCRLDKWISLQEYNLRETELLLAQKLEKMDPEKIVDPDSYVAVPALQSLAYSMDSDELRDLYANLLSKAFYSDTKNGVHPAFVDVIKQMAPREATILTELCQLTECIAPVCKIYATHRKVGMQMVGQSQSISYCPEVITPLNEGLKDTDALSPHLYNLERLGLIAIDFEFAPNRLDYSFTEDFENQYKDFIAELQAQSPKGHKTEISYTHGFIRLTAFGRSFCKTCVFSFEQNAHTDIK